MYKGKHSDKGHWNMQTGHVADLLTQHTLLLSVDMFVTAATVSSTSIHVDNGQINTGHNDNTIDPLMSLISYISAFIVLIPVHSLDTSVLSVHYHSIKH